MLVEPSFLAGRSLTDGSRLSEWIVLVFTSPKPKTRQLEGCCQCGLLSMFTGRLLPANKWIVCIFIQLCPPHVALLVRIWLCDLLPQALLICSLHQPHLRSATPSASFPTNPHCLDTTPTFCVVLSLRYLLVLQRWGFHFCSSVGLITAEWFLRERRNAYSIHPSQTRVANWFSIN